MPETSPPKDASSFIALDFKRKKRESVGKNSVSTCAFSALFKSDRSNSYEKSAVLRMPLISTFAPVFCAYSTMSVRHT